MTRFARAKGSKSSNERTPGDSTPWEVMKEQLLQSKKEKDEAGKRQEAENQRIVNYENFLKEHKVSKRKATWCDFPEEQPKKRLLPLKHLKDNKIQESSNVGESNVASHPQPDLTETKTKKKKKIKNKGATDTPPTRLQPTMAQDELGEGVSQTGKKQKKKNKKKQKPNGDENTTQTFNASESPINDAETSTNKNYQATNKDMPNINKKKKTKIIKGKPVRRKEINDNSFQLIINSKKVELVRFEGFPIMKKDAERLTELRQSMIKKGIPKSEVQRTMKLERRRAEKALARVKREVCYNCRKGGHNLSDCPELKSKIPGVDAADGVCFKCGSTEHRQFECKVQRDKEFRFATCFICRESGHIARQCPDNPKGLYPNGGSCKLCGDVTHLRKDCPTTQNQREETSVKLDTLESADNIEDIGQPGKPLNSIESVKKQPKKIRF